MIPLMLIGSDAVQAIRAECNLCQSSVSINLKTARERFPTACPGCGDPWLAETPAAAELVVELGLTLRKWATSETVKFPFTVRLEVTPATHSPAVKPK